MRRPIRWVWLLALLLGGCLESEGSGTGFEVDRGNDSSSGDETFGFVEDDYGIDCPILGGCIPSKEEFSLAAFISGHHYAFPEPASGQVVTVHALTSFVAQPALKGPKALLLIGLNAQRVTEQTSVPIDLVAVVDKSGSMDGFKIIQAREALRAMAAKLQPEDRFAIVAYDSVASVYLSLTSAAETGTIDAVIDTIFAGGGTNIYDALTLGYQSFTTDAERTRWTVLVSDGQPTVGITSYDSIVDLARVNRVAGIGTSSVGIGGDANSDLMARLGPAGGGMYYFLDDAAALGDVFQAEVSRVTHPMADDVKFTFSLSDRYSFKTLYGFELNGGLEYSIPRVFYEEKAGGFIAEMDMLPGQDNAADWGTLTVSYSPLGATEVTSQTVTIGLPFDPVSAPQNEYHQHHTSQKAYAVLTAGLAIQEAGRLVWEMADLEAADTYLTSAIREFDRQTSSLSGDAELAFTRSLLVGLQANVQDYIQKIAANKSAPLHVLQVTKAPPVVDPSR